MRAGAPVALALVLAAASGCGGTANSSPHRRPGTLDAEGYEGLLIARSLPDVKGSLAFRLEEDNGIFAPCRSFAAPTREIYGMTESERITVIGTREHGPSTDRGLRIGMTMTDAKRLYGAPSHVRPAPYEPGSDVLWRIGRAAGKPVYLRAIVSTRGRVSVLEVGQQPDIQAEEGCV